jgi:glycosyltransferase involved in cell wall biosynthesis
MNRTDTAISSPAVPRVSVVIPTRNRPSLVVRAIASVLAQTFAEFEVIVVVDGPDAATETAVKTIRNRRLRCVVLDEPVGGSEARNRGVLAAEGEWIAFLDDDDEWLTTKLEKQLRLAENSGARVVISCQVVGRYSGQDYLWPRRTPAEGEPICEYLFNRRTWFRGEGQLQTSTLLVPRKLMQEVPFTRGLSKHQDTDWYVRVGAMENVAFRFVLEPLAIWHLGETRSTIVSRCQWTRSWRWLSSVRPKLTKRAYAGFIATQLIGEAAAQGRGLKVAPFLLWKMFSLGRPGPMDLCLFFGNAILTPAVRTRLRRVMSRAKFRQPKIETSAMQTAR